MNIKRFFLTTMIFWNLSISAYAANLTSIDAQTSSTVATVSITLDNPLSPHIRYISQEQCWQIDFMGAAVLEPVEPKAFSIGPVRLVQLSQICQKPLIQRLSLFVQKSVDMKLIKKEGLYQVVLKLVDDRGRRKVVSSDKRQSQPLLVPATLVLDLNRTLTLPLISELARQANIDLKFRDLPPAKVSITTHCQDPFSALEEVCNELQMVMTREIDGWWLTKKTNPLLQFPCDEEVDLSALNGLTTRDALKQICSDECYSRLEKQWPQPLLEQKLGPVNKKASIRSWMDSLIRSQGITQKLASIGE